MRFTSPLIRGTLERRYKRFMADVILGDGVRVVAHCANSGSMKSVCDPGSEVWISPAENPERKLRYTWELIRVSDALVGINTSRPNTLVAEAVTEGVITELAGYESLRREVKYGRNSRIDLLLESPDRIPCYVEVKNVTMRRDLSGPAEFPDAVTSRGAKHLRELADMVAAGSRSVMAFLVQRGDCDRVGLAADIDPGYAEEFERARAAGVEAIAYMCAVGTDSITVARSLPLDA